jgi:chemotaxis protein CheY-P-specific phosphatase CheC
MTTLLKEKLYRASARTFEELAFLLPSETMGEAQAALPMDRAVLVRFSGPFSGRLVLKVSKSLPPALAANMLGEDGPPAESAQSDALKEAANVICGNFLPELAGPKEIFHLQAPEAADAAAPGAAPAASAELGVEDGRCEVEFYTDAPGALPE